MSYTVEVLNLGKRPLQGVEATTMRYGADAAEEAVARHCQLIGEMVLRPRMQLLGAQHHEPVAADGIMASARLTHADDGGRIEIILRRRDDPVS